MHPPLRFDSKSFIHRAGQDVLSAVSLGPNPGTVSPCVALHLLLFSDCVLFVQSVLVCGSTRSIGSGGSDALVGIIHANNGSVQWLNAFGGSAGDVASSVVLNEYSGPSIAGYTSNAGAGGQDIVVSVFDGSGTPVWASVLGTSSDDTGLSILRLNSTGDYFVSGTTGSTLTSSLAAALIQCSRDGDLSPNYAGGYVDALRLFGVTPWAVPTAQAPPTITAPFVTSPHFFNTSTWANLSIPSFAADYHSYLQFFDLDALISPVIQVPFAVPFNVNVAPAVDAGSSISRVAATGSWLSFHVREGAALAMCCDREVAIVCTFA